jgi:hypothetical protein
LGLTSRGNEKPEKPEKLELIDLCVCIRTGTQTRSNDRSFHLYLFEDY